MVADLTPEPRFVSVMEIFDSIQGEGGMLGTPFRFVRFARCNLHCPWCDTDYSLGKSITMLPEQFRGALTQGDSPQWICFTGGEPLLTLPHLLDTLKWLKVRGVKMALETNGTLYNSAVFKCMSYVSVSPKWLSSTGGLRIPPLDPRILSHGIDELRIAVGESYTRPHDFVNWISSLGVLSPSVSKIKRIYFSPIFQSDTYFPPEYYKLALTLARVYCKFGFDARVSVQLHKLIGVR